MKTLTKFSAIYLLSICVCVFGACGNSAESSAGNDAPEKTQTQPSTPSKFNSEVQTNNNTSKVPNLQAEILAQKNTKTDSSLGTFDFKNYTYPFPRGWHDNDSNEFTLENGKRAVSKEKIGISYVTTLYGEATGDGLDEAFVILKIDTGGSAIPQMVYVFSWQNDQPELVWQFRTGDRADGGLKNIWTENNSIIIQLYGQDRYILGESETNKINGDEEQISFPKYFTKTVYKWNGSAFRMEGKRLTYKIGDENAPPVENMGEIAESQMREEK